MAIILKLKNLQELYDSIPPAKDTDLILVKLPNGFKQITVKDFRELALKYPKCSPHDHI